MTLKNYANRFTGVSLFALIAAGGFLTGCNSGGSAGSSPDANVSNATTTDTSTTAPVTNPAPTATPAPTAAPSSGQVGESCVSGDANKICLGIQFVSYVNSKGQAVASQEDAKTILATMNRIWGQCDIGFQIDKYETVDPTKAGLAFGADAQGQTDKIRTTYGTMKNDLLAVTTGPWGTAVNAWTNMPGSGPYGAVMESSIVDYGSGIIYAHEFGHYLGLDHVDDTSDLMDAVIYTSSSSLTSAECQTARDTAKSFWAAMIRK